jgi:protein-S-isoprenylcysteine O-methyltransferase Ste14
MSISLIPALHHRLERDDFAGSRTYKCRTIPRFLTCPTLGDGTFVADGRRFSYLAMMTGKLPPRGVSCFYLHYEVACDGFAMNRFFQRGGVWVLLQSILLASVILLAVFFRGGGFQPVVVTTGVVLLLIAGGVALAGVLAIGRNLTPFPKPGAQAQLVRHGIYAVIRHPLYLSVMAGAMGWALVWQSWPALLVAAFLIPFFLAKARREERWLREKFPEYADYERQVRGFVPWR